MSAKWNSGTTPLKHIDDEDAEIGVCVLSGLNVVETKLEEYEDVCDVIVRMLDELIDYQEYPVKAAENFCRKRRSIGVGITNLAAYLAKNKTFYWDKNAPNLVDELCEHMAFFLLKSSCKLAEEKGVCEKYGETTYSKGLLPIDKYNKAVDGVCDRKPVLDWEGLRADIKKFGLRHSTVGCQQPFESCLDSSTKVLTEHGFLDFKEICEYGGVDYKNIEEKDLVGWHYLDKIIKVPTKEGTLEEVDKIYYNGYKEVLTLTLENGKEVQCTPTHKFLVNTKNGQVWKMACDLEEGDDIVEFGV